MFKNIFQTIFSVKNVKNKKVFTILGIKIKFDREKLKKRISESLINQIYVNILGLKNGEFKPRYNLVRKNPFLKLFPNNFFSTFIITKFNINIIYGIYKREELKKEDIVTNKDYLEKRFKLFEKYYLPSLNSQTDKKFKAIVLFHTQTPEEFKEKIKQYKKQYDFFEPLYVDSYNIDAIREVIKKTTKNNWIMTLRIDNDDAVSTKFVETMKQNFAPIDKMYLSPADGACFEVNNNIAYSYRHKSGHFLGKVERNDKNLVTVYQKNYDEFMEHPKAIKLKDFLLIETPKEPMWLEVIHDSNVSNIGKNNKENKISLEIFGI